MCIRDSNDNERLRELYKDYYLNEWKLRYSMVHRGDKNTDDNVKTELLVTNYDITGSDNSVILNLLLDL